MPSKFAMNLKMYLDLRGMTRGKLAEQVGVTEVAIGRYVSGEREPKAVTVAAIADALDVTVDDLMGRKPAEHDETRRAVDILARSAGELTDAERRTLINAIMGDYRD